MKTNYPIYGLFVRLNALALSNVEPTCIATGSYKEMIEESANLPGSWIENMSVQGRDTESDE